jgi:hypothetical protein
MLHRKIGVAVVVTLVAMIMTGTMSVSAEEFTISVWAGGSNMKDSYRWEAIEMAADILMREIAIRGLGNCFALLDEASVEPLPDTRALIDWHLFKSCAI